MTRTLTGTIIALLCCVGAGCRATKPTTPPHNPAEVHEQTTTAANPTIEVREDKFPDGTVARRTEGYIDEEGNFIPHGAMTYFWDNGNKKSQVHHVHGVRHGPRKAWHKTGQIWSKGAFVDGREDGVWTEWYPNGNKAREFHFRNGAWHGLYTEWYPNGQKKLEVEYVNGKRQGMLRGWDEYGTVVKQVEYVDNVPQP